MIFTVLITSGTVSQNSMLDEIRSLIEKGDMPNSILIEFGQPEPYPTEKGPDPMIGFVVTPDDDPEEIMEKIKKMNEYAASEAVRELRDARIHGIVDTLFNRTVHGSEFAGQGENQVPSHCPYARLDCNFVPTNHGIFAAVCSQCGKAT